MHLDAEERNTDVGHCFVTAGAGIVCLDAIKSCGRNTASARVISRSMKKVLLRT